VAVVDNLARGHRPAVHPAARFHRLGLRQSGALARVLLAERTDCVMHFAALTDVGESVREPLLYYRNNTAGTLSLLAAMDRAGVNRIIFSSTCAVYGTHAESPIAESCPREPISPYGRSKQAVEDVLIDRAAADPDFGFVALRYFNAAGCAADGSLGEDHRPETHLIPILLQTALGQREAVTLFGADYETPDGTCIRDYIHVEDLAAAHLSALAAVTAGTAAFYNVGIGRGFSVREVIAAVERVTGKSVPLIEGARRPGDPPALVADPRKVQADLGWRPLYTDLDETIATAWRWFRTRPHGYRAAGTLRVP
jgi:UDP-glucose-4-epimerase GalE